MSLWHIFILRFQLLEGLEFNTIFFLKNAKKIHRGLDIPIVGRFRLALLKGVKHETRKFTKENEISLLCTPHPDHFYCEKNSSNVKSEGELYILAEINYAKGIEIKYQLPLKEN